MKMMMMMVVPVDDYIKSYYLHDFPPLPPFPRSHVPSPVYATRRVLRARPEKQLRNGVEKMVVIHLTCGGGWKMVCLFFSGTWEKPRITTQKNNNDSNPGITIIATSSLHISLHLQWYFLMWKNCWDHKHIAGQIRSVVSPRWIPYRPVNKTTGGRVTRQPGSMSKTNRRDAMCILCIYIYNNNN